MKAKETQPELIYNMKLKDLHILLKYHFMDMEISKYRTLMSYPIKR